MPKILVVDDEVSLREVVRNSLSMKGYEVSTVPTAEQALEIIFREPFDVILLDINLSDASGISVLKKIRELREKLPVVIYTGALTAELEKEAMAAGANEILRKDIGVPRLTQRIDKIIGAAEHIFKKPSEQKQRSVLIVDDEDGVRRVLTEFFRMKNYETWDAENGEKALELARSRPFSVVLLDINMPGMDGVSTLEKLKEINPNLGVVMVTGNQEDENIKRAIELGAYGYVLKPFDFLYLNFVVMSRLAIAGSN